MAKNESSITLAEEAIMTKIYVIRSQKVMLDGDLAELYGVENKQLKRQVRRNLDRFPQDFMFELSPTEFNNWRSQIGTSSWGGTRYLPMAFTEHGVLMLSSILNSKKAIQVNIQIMRIFTRMRQFLADNTQLRLALEKLENKTNNNTKNIELVFQYIDELTKEKKKNSEPRKSIGYKLPKDN